MRSFLVHEGWETNENLPKSWMYWEAQRYTSGISVTTKILADDGQMFESFLTAMDYIKSNPKYNIDDITNLQTFMKQRSKERRQSLDSWESNDKFPIGWKRRVVNGFKHSRNMFMSPSGEQFASERVALEHMIENKYDPAEIAKMQEIMKEAGWEMNRFLPDGWMIRSSYTFSKNMIVICIVESNGTKQQCKAYVLDDDNGEVMNSEDGTF